MNIKISAPEAIDRGIWIKLCEIKGINPWAYNEGMIDKNELIDLTEDEARQLGVIERSK